jgi:hypothetical protein
MLPLGKDGQIDPAMADEMAETYEKTKAPAAIAHARRRTPTDQPALQSDDLLADTRVTLESPRE